MHKVAQSSTPSKSLVVNLQRQLRQVMPFAEMDPGHVNYFIECSVEHYFEPDEVILQPNSGPALTLFFVRQGSVVGRRGIADEFAEARRIDTGEFFPVSAVMAGRTVTSVYSAFGDCFCMAISRADALRLSEVSPPFAAFVSQRILKFLEMSRKLVQRTYASEVFTALSLETPLGALPRKQAVSIQSGQPLRDALLKMHQTRVGSVLVLDEQGRLKGILTRDDVVSRVALAGLDLESRIDDVMSHQVKHLQAHDTAQEAALMMSRYGIRHVPVLEGDQVVNVVSERDLFSAQRLSLKSVSASIRSAPDLLSLQVAAGEVRQFAQTLLGQGVQSRQLTALISHLNDLICERLVLLFSDKHRLNLTDFAWIALGSEGRGEQTISTDQDNALVFRDGLRPETRESLLTFAQDVNAGLDACGFPLCKGHIMASNPELCLAESEWMAKFANWIEHGSPENLLRSSIFFDFRVLAGNASLTDAMRELVRTRSMATPRFIKQLADNSSRSQVPLNWHGGVETVKVDGRECLDLKMGATALVVDVARIFALSKGIVATNTRVRLEQVGQALGLAAREYESWVTAFDFMQTLRLNIQIQRTAVAGNPNLIELASLNDIDRSILKESLKTIRQLQQRLELDYAR